MCALWAALIGFGFTATASVQVRARVMVKVGVADMVRVRVRKVYRNCSRPGEVMCPTDYAQ